jgi:hypothetical protein
VWYCAVRAALGDRVLADDGRAQVASDVMHLAGLVPLRAGRRRGAVGRGTAMTTSTSWRCLPARTAAR